MSIQNINVYLFVYLFICRYFPSGDAFASGSDDATVSLLNNSDDQVYF